MPDWSFGEPRGLTIDAEQQNRESNCVILDKRVAILLETYTSRKSPNLAIIFHLAHLLDISIQSVHVTSASIQHHLLHHFA
jgi:hypothetical protein